MADPDFHRDAVNLTPVTDVCRSVTTRLLLMLPALALAISACGDPSESAAPRRTSTTAPATSTTELVTTTTTETPPAEVLDDDSRLSFEGLGAVRAGMTIEEVERAAGVPLVRTELPACTALSPRDDPEGVEFIFPGGEHLEFVFARPGSKVRSASGIALGDHEDAVLRAHPDAEVKNPGREVHRIVVRESEHGRRLMFEIDRERVGVMWSGPDGSEFTDEICS